MKLSRITWQLLLLATLAAVVLITGCGPDIDPYF